MRLGLIAPIPPPYGGISNWVQMISSYIEEGNLEGVELTCINTAPKKRSTEGRTLWNRVVGSGIRMVGILFQVKQAVKREKAEVLHITTSGQLALFRDIAVLFLAFRNRIPTVYHIRFGRVTQIAQENSIEWKLMKYALKLASCIMVLDRNTEATLQEALGHEKMIRCIPNPIDTRREGKGQYFENKVVVFVGWVVKEKGIEELLEAWQAISSVNKEWLLKIIGPIHPEYYKELKEKFSMEHVIFEGERKHSEVIELLKVSSIFVLPSYTEGFPNAVLEAMLARMAIIATEVGAIPDMLKDDCGICIPKQNVVKLQHAIERLLASPEERRKLGTNAYKKAIEMYSLDIVMRKYKVVWDELLSNM